MKLLLEKAKIKISKKIFLLCLLFLSFPLIVLAQPIVYITDVIVDGQSINVSGSESATVQPNDTFWISVTIENQGDSWSGHGQCVIWVVNYNNVESFDENYFDKPPYDEAPTNGIYPSGSTKWHITDGPFTTSSVSVEAEEETWYANEDQTAEIRITAPSSGSIYFLVRASFF